MRYENFQVEKEGLFYEGQHLTKFNLSVTRKKLTQDSANKRRKLYKVEIDYADDRSNQSEWISDLRNIDLFDCFGINDCSISKETKKLLLFKLMHEAEQISWEYVVDSQLGLQVINGYPIYVFGENVLWANNNLDEFSVITHYTMTPDKYMDREELLKECMSYKCLIPGTTEILFYGSLFAIVKPFLAQLNIPCGFLLALVAPAGHLKTTLARIYALWLDTEDEQEIGFYTYQKDKDILNMIANLQGQNFLLDDIHKIADSNERKRQEKRLDIVSRYVNMNKNCANVIITGETMEEMGIFSCIDRIFQIRIPEMNASQIENLKISISSLKQGLMPSVALAFANALMEKYEEVMEDIKTFYSKNLYDTEAAEGCATRVYRYGMFIRMTKYLFDKYLCDPALYIQNDETILDSAIKEHVQVQQVALQKIHFREKKRDYIAELYWIIHNRGQYIQVRAQLEYNDFENSCMLCNDRIYITSNAIKNAFINYCGHYTSVKLIIDALHEEGILEEEPSSNGKQKNYQGKKHYVLNRKIFANYMYNKGYELAKADCDAYFRKA